MILADTAVDTVHIVILVCVLVLVVLAIISRVR